MIKPPPASLADISEPDRIVDCIGLQCPLPVLKARKALRQLRPGQLVRVDSTDPVAILDVPAMAREDGHLVQDVERDGDVARFFIRRGSA
ncbi:MAG: sulfurtransferase TusA family protein [Pseudomonadota bacterium]